MSRYYLNIGGQRARADRKQRPLPPPAVPRHRTPVTHPGAKRRPDQRFVSKPEPPPTFSECVVGYRVWRIDGLGRLRPTNVDLRPWKPGINTAVCEAHRYGVFGLLPSAASAALHLAPRQDCNCGLYARFDSQSIHHIDYTHLDVDAMHMPIVAGSIAAWGTVQVHSDGIRAEHACVTALAVPDDAPGEIIEVVNRVADVYRVPRVPIAALEAEGQMHGNHLPDSVRPPKPPQEDMMSAAIAQFVQAVQASSLSVRRKGTS